MKKVLRKDDLFICYSLNLFHFLKANGFYYLYKDRNPSTNLFYWTFERTPKLSEALEIYMKNKTN
jgi:hypothetical protein